MKPRYLGFRALHHIKSKLGLLKIGYPTNPKFKSFLNKSNWTTDEILFFIPTKRYQLNSKEKERLKIRAEKILNHIYIFFSSKEYDLKNNLNWSINPETGYRYDSNKHWTQINDFSTEAGDIKFTWERARFSFIYDIIRYNHYFNVDCSKFIIEQIISFIDENPINQGPHYKCSQEISIRILNWTYALFYFKQSPYLTDKHFQKIINSIYWQLKHVYKNINFSRIAVRNNHAITEVSLLYLSKYLYPFFKESKKWSAKGKNWLLQEIDYQIYNDGSYLQFSHNYHRVVIQTLTWVLKINQLHKITFPTPIINKLQKTLDFLSQHQDSISGWLPNYGSNDGALFFSLNENHYRDFRPQLQTFGILVNQKLYDKIFEDPYWFDLDTMTENLKPIDKKSIFTYKIGGFYGFRDNALTTIRCGKYKDRPSQADALHLDIWYNGINVLFDPGTYKYNTNQNLIKFYTGTSGHNTLSIGNSDQMLKGRRFIWYFWTKSAFGECSETEDYYKFYGKIKGFRELGKNIYHERTVIKYKNKLHWRIIDKTNYQGNEKIKIHWNINPRIKDKVQLTSIDKKNIPLEMEERDGWYSIHYGEKEKFKQIVYFLPNGYSDTTLSIKQ